VEQPLVLPFETSFSRDVTRSCLMVKVFGDGFTGWGECPVDRGPLYSYETIDTAWSIMIDWLIPAILNQDFDQPADIPGFFTHVRGHPMARAGIENAVWDLVARMQGVSLAQLLGGTLDQVQVGVSIGIEPTIDLLLERIEAFRQDGYRRIKLKIKPGWDVDVLKIVRSELPDFPLQVDANAAYSRDDIPHLMQLDDLNLLMVEQPFHYDDLVDHAALQAKMNTPVCLDESIHSPEHARWALELDACRMINIKVARVGGFSAARQIHDLCAAHGVPVWCGGMLETNVGRAGNLALASLPNFKLPGDISASARYYEEDIAAPDFVLNADSTISVPDSQGTGVEVNEDILAKYTFRTYSSAT
jgi:O-succinylbenzoate synthase